ncbi:isocitrate lyase/phosphoenolpyruvate mutase family protein [Shewanella submarina]|uniref:Isocitrate lyase/phosphoenolpyruvate mutase family protein n=1 Tax=Shewanella submarina TaxID=2016376 RepID=A0ABV7GB69_9GAMM|nr:isocitrate lyase/phosphoenolpyruvate mutase family protein [Shewanella submarina]MCL1040018.1 isocitrate lyase/phosphoenolpyruvate mutase family protein [Shewanella submarina]
MKIFKDRNTPLLLANVWDRASAIAAGYEAMGTSSAAIAANLGYSDGEQMPFGALYGLVKDIRQNTTIPMTVDIEGGYASEPEKIAKQILSLIKLGVVGINIEDSMLAGKRELLDKGYFARRLQQIINCLGAAREQLFINVRCDLFFQDNPTTEEAVSRAELYQQAGANGIFFPGLTNHSDISQISQQLSLPINLMALPNLPNYQELAKLNISRISMGNWLYESRDQGAENLLQKIKETKDMSLLFT